MYRNVMLLKHFNRFKRTILLRRLIKAISFQRHNLTRMKIMLIARSFCTLMCIYIYMYYTGFYLNHFFLFFNLILFNILRTTNKSLLFISRRRYDNGNRKVLHCIANKMNSPSEIITSTRRRVTN